MGKDEFQENVEKGIMKFFSCDESRAGNIQEALESALDEYPLALGELLDLFVGIGRGKYNYDIENQAVYFCPACDGHFIPHSPCGVNEIRCPYCGHGGVEPDNYVANISFERITQEVKK